MYSVGSFTEQVFFIQSKHMLCCKQTVMLVCDFIVVCYVCDLCKCFGGQCDITACLWT